jgi:pentatricopeptide repeat-containing protein PET309
MLERTAGCLETGSLRRLLPASKKSVKSRRTLHSGFWNHGAGDIELSPLWAALVQAAEPLNQQRESQMQQRNSNGMGGVFLEFLYPAGTLSFLRQYSGWGVERSETRWPRTGFGRLGHRQFTSVATASGADLMRGVDVPEESTKVSTDDQNLELLRQLMSITRDTDFEEAWRQYELLGERDQGRTRKQIIQYLSRSERVVDAERTTELFEMLDKDQRDPTTIQHAIQSYLRLRNLSDAVQIHKAAIENLKSPVGSGELLAYLINNSLWTRALSIWNDVQELRNRSPQLDYNVFAALDSLPNLGSRASELADYVNKSLNPTSADITTPPSRLLNFASRVLRRAILNSQTFTPSRFTALLQNLQDWHSATPQLYEEAVNMLLTLNQSKLAVQSYRQARRHGDIKFTRPMLHTMLKLFCDNHSVMGMQQILDDFFRYYTKPSRIAYKMCMSEFAAQGDAQTVHALFDQYTGRFVFKGGNPLISADDIAPVLHVHAKRGELKEVVRLFNQIQDNYGLQPTLRCWNILINVYGKVHDTDSAYECFEGLLQSGDLQPDNYTFGTLMGICVSRGDLRRALELYKLAEDMGVQRSIAMIDSLVLGHIQDEQLDQAEEICEDAIGLELQDSRSRMWNYLLVAYAMRRDLNNVNRLLRRMAEAKVEYDEYTYSALMQALAVVRQPDRAYAILCNVMPDAGVKATPFHYAIVMGGYLANGEIHKVFQVQNRMIRRGLKKTASSNLMVLKATAATDQKLYEEGPDTQRLERATQMFRDVVSSIDPQEMSDPSRKSTGRLPLNVTYSTMFYNYIMFVLSANNEFRTVEKLYEEFKLALPDNRRNCPPIEVLSALMETKLRERDHEGVQQCWDLALAQAIKQGRPLLIPSTLSKDAADTESSFKGSISPMKNSSSILRNPMQPALSQKIVSVHQLDLSNALTTYMRSLAQQLRIDDITKVVNDLLQDGFKLDNNNWNHYIVLLVRGFKYKLAFELCESKLMGGWTGWARLRWQAPERNRLPLELRNLKKQRTHMRAKYHMLLYLARSYLQIQSLAAESRGNQMLLQDIERDCPRTIQAIKTMPRTDDVLEREVLHGY